MIGSKIRESGFKSVIIMPVFNEEVMAGPLLSILCRAVDHIIVIDDGSTDSTRDIILQLAHKERRIKPVFLERNLGKGRAIKYGFYLLKEMERKNEIGADDIVFTLDGDGQHNPVNLDILWERLDSAGLDVVIARRSFDSYPLVRRLGNRFLSAFCSILSGVRLYDSESGFRCLRVKTVLEILPYYGGWYYSDSQELAVISGRLGLRVNNDIGSDSFYYRKPGARYRDGLVNILAGFQAFLRTCLKIKHKDDKIIKDLPRCVPAAQNEGVETGAQGLTEADVISGNKVLLVYPPGPLCIREDRCQVPLKGMVAATLRPPIDLAAVAAGISGRFEKLLWDCPAEGRSIRDFAKDIKSLRPAWCIVHMSYSSLKEDLYACSVLKYISPQTRIIAKGPVFTEHGNKILKDYPCIEAAVTGEAELVIPKFIEGKGFRDMPGLIRREAEEIKSRPYEGPLFGLDELPRPDRKLIQNRLYREPLSGEAQTVIYAQRGCPHGCSFCLAETVSGSLVRYRSCASMIEEIEECISRYSIKRFFFKGDSFTFDRLWVMELCRLIADKGLNIRWLTNSRVDNLDEELILSMKKAGCEGLALGVESSSDITNKRAGKSISRQQTEKAVRLCEKAGMRLMAMYIIGWPWESRQDIYDTLRLAKRLNTAVAEFNFFVPFPGTPLYDEYKGMLGPDPYIFSYDYSTNPFSAGGLSAKELLDIRSDIYLRYYLRWAYFYKNILPQLAHGKQFLRCLRYGLVKMGEMFS